MVGREELKQAIRDALALADEIGEAMAGCHLSTALDVLDQSSRTSVTVDKGEAALKMFPALGGQATA